MPWCLILQPIVENAAKFTANHAPAGVGRVELHARRQDRLLAIAVRDNGPALSYHRLVTAYDQHAVSAFEVAALDDLLKPVENDSFRATLARARKSLARANGVESPLTAAGGDYALRLRNGTRLRVARSRRDVLAGRLGIA